MNKSEFRRLCQEQLVYLDGATGSNLIKRGMPANVCPEKWIIENRDIMIQLQREYVEAGSNIIYAPTFGTNRVKLSEYGLAQKAEEMIHALVGISKAAVGNRAYIAGDITMTGRQVYPIGDMPLKELIEIYKEQITHLVNAGVDLLVVETMLSLQECRAAVLAAKEVCDLPIMVSMTFEKDGRTLFGSDAKTAAVVLEALGVDAFGVNCAAGPRQLVSLISDIVAVTNIPVIAKPNAGLPFVDEKGNTGYNLKVNEFVEEMLDLVNAGATLIGGCCGTTPEYMKALKDRVGIEKTVTRPRKPEGIRYLASERQLLSFGLHDPFFVVGERINPTGKKKLQAELLEGSMDLVLQYAREQEENGAKVLDVNMGMSGIDEVDMLVRAVHELCQVTDLPLSLDSSNIEAMEEALLAYPGRALVNSVSLEKAKIEKLLPLVKKYGAMFILLPLSDKGLPENQEEKLQFLNAVYEKAQELGLTKEDIVVDGLVATVGANPLAAKEVLSTISYCIENGFATTCGLSNISFGMPERMIVNTTFLTMAIGAGLTMAIANPMQQALMSAVYASDMLLAKEDSAIRYIEYANVMKEANEAAKAQMAVRGMVLPKDGTGVVANNGTKCAMANETGSPLDTVYESVLKGKKGQIAKDVKNALDAGMEPQKLLDEGLLAAIREVGVLFEKGKYFLPQLMNSAEAMKLGIEVIEPLLKQDENGAVQETVVIATVEGDIHDIGKNLVALMLKNYGYRVVDLGKDVPARVIVDRAKEEDAKIIILSALMTTTMMRMEDVIAITKVEMPDVKVMVGGAVITQAFADSIGAHGYSKDAAEAVKVADQLLS